MNCRLSAALVAALASTAAAEIPKTAADYIRERVDKGHDVGIAACVIDASGTSTFVYGNADPGVPLKEDALFEIGSITKAYNALIFADMVAKGELGLDDTVGQRFPARLPRKTAGITLRQLVSHTSGLPRVPDAMYIPDETNPYKEFGDDELGIALAGTPLLCEPGKQYEYSNLGAGLLGNILARRAGKSWEALAKERVLDPLGLKDTTVTLSDEQKARLSPGHLDDTKTLHWQFDALAGAGALIATVTDVARFSAANAGMAPSPLAEAMKAMQKPIADAKGMANTKVGMGWHITATRDGKSIVWHNGGTAGFRSFTGFIPGGNRAVAVLTNTSTEVDRLGMHLLDPSLPLPPVKTFPKAVALEPERLAAFEGKYTMANGAEFDVRVEDGRLTIQLSGQGRLPVYPESATKFFYKVVEAQVEFEPGPGGKAAKLTLFQNGMTMPAPRTGD